jgi:hypothetical protein
MSRVRRNAERAGRDPAELDFAYSVNWYDTSEAQVVDGERRPLTGNAVQASDDVKRLEEMGVNHLMLGFQAPTLDDTLGQLQRFTDEVRPLTA